jgi:hypothetical protein
MKKSVYTYLLLITLISSCNNPFAPGLTDKDPNANMLLTEQRTAEEVLINFSYAYNFKDSLIYADLLDSTFNFSYTNFGTDPITQDHWGRDVDIKTTMGMFRHFQTINLVWDGTLDSRFTNSDSTEKTIWKSFKLTLDGGLEISTLSGEAIFTFKKKFLNLPDTTGTWKITSWIDKSKF